MKTASASVPTKPYLQKQMGATQEFGLNVSFLTTGFDSQSHFQFWSYGFATLWGFVANSLFTRGGTQALSPLHPLLFS